MMVEFKVREVKIPIGLNNRMVEVVGRWEVRRASLGMSSLERNNVRFQENHWEVKDYDDMSPPFNRFEDTANYNEDQSFPLDESLK